MTMKADIRILFLATLVAGLGTTTAQAQAVSTPPSPLADAQLTWQECQRLTGNNEARLACFDRWAQQQSLPAAAVPPAPAVLADTPPPTPVDASVPATRVVSVGTTDGCRDRQYGSLSRFWELEAGTNCGTLGFRGYRPLNVSLGLASRPPETPTSPAPGRDGVDRPYQAQDMRIGLSLRTKLAQGLLTGDDPSKKDSLWFGYTQQSTWQVFNEELSRPFRSTDHEPEFIYAYPSEAMLGGGWRLRYTGLGLVHQSNGQDLPLSRSWNRVYLMGGADLDDRYVITGRIWKRIKETTSKAGDPSGDDNPDIEDFIGRAEVKGIWNFNRDNQFGVTVRNNLRASGKGSIRLEWLKAIGDPDRSNLRFHTQLFYGYGDTLLDYNVKRTVFMMGLSLVDF
jgi:phospholipase A1